MAKKKAKKFDSQFRYEELEQTLSGFTAFAGHSFTKRYNPNEYNSLLPLLPSGYVGALNDKLESIDLIYSGSSASPFLLTLAVGRNDQFNGTECFDIDVFNIAPDTGATSSFFLTQWYHFKDDNGERTSYEIAPLIITDDLKRKDMTYATFLTGSTSYFTLEEYEKDRNEFFKLHTKSFGEL